jgi:O-antigen/teichoic acid export membrane protein
MRQQRTAVVNSAGLLQGSAWITAGQLFAVAARFLAGLVVARVLGPEGRGQYALVVLVPSLLTMVLSLGLGPAATYLLGRQKVPVGQVAANSLLWGAGGGTTIVLGLLVFWGVAQPPFLPDLSFPLVALSCAAVPFALVHLFISYAFLGLGQAKKFGILLLIEGFGQVVYLILFVIAAQWGLLGATLAWTLTVVTQALFAVAWLGGRVLLSLRPNLQTFREALSYGLRIYPMAVMQYLALRFDQLLVEFFAGTGPLGLYAIAISLAEAALQIPMALSTALFSRVSTSTNLQADLITPRVLRATVILTVLEAGALLVLARPLVQFLFGFEFESAVPALLWLLPGIVLYAVARILAGDLAGRGYPLLCSLAVGISLIATIVLDFAWIPGQGIVGAAWASSVAYGAHAAVLLIGFLRISRPASVQLARPRR